MNPVPFNVSWTPRGLKRLRELIVEHTTRVIYKVRRASCDILSVRRTREHIGSSLRLLTLTPCMAFGPCVVVTPPVSSGDFWGGVQVCAQWGCGCAARQLTKYVLVFHNRTASIIT